MGFFSFTSKAKSLYNKVKPAIAKHMPQTTGRLRRMKTDLAQKPIVQKANQKINGIVKKIETNSRSHNFRRDFSVASKPKTPQQPKPAVKQKPIVSQKPVIPTSNTPIKTAITPSVKQKFAQSATPPKPPTVSAPKPSIKR